MASAAHSVTELERKYIKIGNLFLRRSLRWQWSSHGVSHSKLELSLQRVPAGSCSCAYYFGARQIPEGGEHL